MYNYYDDEEDDLHNMIMIMIMTMRRVIKICEMDEEDNLDNYADDYCITGGHM